MVADLPAAELDSRIALLPPISRGAHLAGPRLQAERLVELWKVADAGEVSLAQAYRLLGVAAVEASIWRFVGANEYPGDTRYWTFPPLADLLPKLHEVTWQAMLAGDVVTQAVKGVRGKRHRIVLSAELARLTPDWRLSRLTIDSSDEFIDVRVRRIPTEPIKKAWRQKPSQTEVEAAITEIAKDYAPGAQPSENEIWRKLKDRLGPNVGRKQMRNGLKNVAPQLRGRRGYPSTKSPA